MPAKRLPAGTRVLPPPPPMPPAAAIRIKVLSRRMNAALAESLNLEERLYAQEEEIARLRSQVAELKGQLGPEAEGAAHD